MEAEMEAEMKKLRVKGSMTFGEVMAQGEFGVIIKGFYMGRPVAIKQILLHEKSRHTLQMLHDEVKILSKVKHANIVEFLGVLSDFPMKSNGRFFPYALMFELCDESLWVRLHRKRHRYDMREKLRIISEISAAVSHLHKKHIVHQDLSSSNVLLSFSGTVKLSDFGFARECKNGSHENEYIVGCEVDGAAVKLLGKPVTTKSDVWALGCLTWEVVSGKFPWNERNVNDRRGLAQHIALDSFRDDPGLRLSSSQFHKRVKAICEHARKREKDVAVEKKMDVDTLRTWLHSFYETYNKEKLEDVPYIAKFHQGEFQMTGHCLDKCERII
ncbi:hypothetical protein GUITHDRAFT_119091 [Guillardia theta CCMP2712]|uniref:Protein kinase domain-containing protein n=1 Tax=Guillardia theta (strain CCMP2712) TaxID=905079 RepID=L1IG48_GUITC|nr:hypothetical protein GUITHDRAFT_119091 [Guillardia theta CCMP2712]EKX34780.1 hypothetical protein GUITHDRAFT_119091 [Guillardia theta CCMP2712]|eukprot:XP_005821760.1 hypothetical protein GUITHDRAFT_119091 [Guillardia theta CCMP2712]